MTLDQVGHIHETGVVTVQASSRVSVGEADVLNARKALGEIQRVIAQAVQDRETAPVMMSLVGRLGDAEGELQAFQDYLDYVARHDATQVLVRLTETVFDPVTLHDVRRAGYKRAVSHIFRATK